VRHCCSLRMRHRAVAVRPVTGAREWCCLPPRGPRRTGRSTGTITRQLYRLQAVAAQKRRGTGHRLCSIDRALLDPPARECRVRRKRAVWKNAAGDRTLRGRGACGRAASWLAARRGARLCLARVAWTRLAGFPAGLGVRGGRVSRRDKRGPTSTAGAWTSWLRSLSRRGNAISPERPALLGYGLSPAIGTSPRRRHAADRRTSCRYR
jgi:hypothetical protein